MVCGYGDEVHFQILVSLVQQWFCHVVILLTLLSLITRVFEQNTQAGVMVLTCHS